MTTTSVYAAYPRRRKAPERPRPARRTSLSSPDYPALEHRASVRWRQRSRNGHGQLPHVPRGERGAAQRLAVLLPLVPRHRRSPRGRRPGGAPSGARTPRAPRSPRRPRAPAPRPGSPRRARPQGARRAEALRSSRHGRVGSPGHSRGQGEARHGPSPVLSYFDFRTLAAAARTPAGSALGARSRPHRRVRRGAERGFRRRVCMRPARGGESRASAPVPRAALP